MARTLEKQWEEALAVEEKLKLEYEQFLNEQPTPLQPEERSRIRQLAGDIPTIWHSATTTAADRQAIARLLLERVIVTVLNDSEKVNVEYHWAGGHQTCIQMIRPVARIEQLSYYPELLERISVLHKQGQKSGEIAQVLNEEGWRPAKRRATFNASMISVLLSRQGLQSGSTRQQHTHKIRRKPNEWTLKELARELEMPEITLYCWLRKGKLIARQESQTSRSIWLIQANRTELERLRALRSAPRSWSKRTQELNTSPT